MRRWNCGLCGQDVVEGQRFTFIGSIGAVHVECLLESYTRQLDKRDLIALLDANEVLLYAIVRFKEAERIASGEVKSILSEARREIEKIAGRIALMLGQLST
ncbi:MAG: DUF2175 family protein [Acidilobaceae archaeon]